MKRDIYDWILTCDKCSKQIKPQQTHRHPLTVWKTSHTFWKVALDIKAPLPKSDGFKHIFFIGDQFSKCHEVDSMQNQEATISLADCWFSRFGCPSNMQSEKSANLMSNRFKIMCKELGIDCTSTTAYHPQDNAMIERTNRTIEESLAKYVGEHHNT